MSDPVNDPVTPRQLAFRPYGNGFEIGRPDDLDVRELETWGAFRGELLARVFGGRSVAVAERSWSGTQPLTPMLTQYTATRILRKAFWLTVLEPADPNVLRELGADGDNWGGELWVVATPSVERAEELLRSIENSFAPDSQPPQASCEAMATVFDDHAVWWLAPQLAADEVRRAVDSVASAVGWRIADWDDVD